MAEIVVVPNLSGADRSAVLELLAIAQRADDHPPLADHKLIEVEGTAPPGGFGVVARSGSAAVAYVHATAAGSAPGVWNLQSVVHPAERDGALRAAVTRTACDEAIERGARRLQWWALRAGDADDALAFGLGLAPWRDLCFLRVSLPHPETPAVPDGMRLRSFDPGRDDDAWLAVNARSFAGHPEQGGVTAGELHALMAEPWFSADDFLLAEEVATGALTGFCWTKVPGPDHGEIYVIGVDPDFQGSGLGRALVLAGLARIAAHGVGRATLYVDGENAAARALYDDLGFSLDHVDRAYAADVPTGVAR